MSRVHFDNPSVGYVETSEPEVAFNGTVDKQVGAALTVVVERQIYGGGYEVLSRQQVHFEGNHLAFRVPSPEVSRYMTRITVKSMYRFRAGRPRSTLPDFI